jgi:hypothetical protein
VARGWLAAADRREQGNARTGSENSVATLADPPVDNHKVHSFRGQTDDAEERRDCCSVLQFDFFRVAREVSVGSLRQGRIAAYVNFHDPPLLGRKYHL